MNVESYIGIDPGATTGMAAWDARIQEYEEFESGGFWQVYNRVLRYPLKTTVIFAEDPNMISPTFPRKIKAKGRQRDAMMQKIGQNVGMNKRDAQLLIDGFKGAGFTVYRVKPTGRRGTKRKWTAETFMNITGHHKGLNEHVRDAAMMVFGLPHCPISRYQNSN